MVTTSLQSSDTSALWLLLDAHAGTVPCNSYSPPRSNSKMGPAMVPWMDLTMQRTPSMQRGWVMLLGSLLRMPWKTCHVYLGSLNNWVGWLDLWNHYNRNSNPHHSFSLVMTLLPVVLVLSHLYNPFGYIYYPFLFLLSLPVHRRCQRFSDIGSGPKVRH